MILIADSGSTKTDWMLASGDNRWQQTVVKTQGLNPVLQQPDVIAQTLENELKPQLAPYMEEGSVQAVCFYGAGCTPAQQPLMRQLLEEAFQGADVEVHSDLVGAARALCGQKPGIACILGTGANSCLYDGTELVQNTPALGYVLGDEGSGAVLGRLFLNAIFKNPQLADVRDAFLADSGMTRDDVIRRVYREPMANRFLASTSLFVAQHLEHPLLRQLVVDNFRQFFRSNIVPYGRRDLPIDFVGSMAYHYRQQLEEAARQEGFTVGKTEKSPLEGLAAYHIYK